MKNLMLSIIIILVGIGCLTSCQIFETDQQRVEKLTTEKLLTIVKNEEDLYGPAIDELGNRPDDGTISGPVLAEALARPRRDSYFAGFALIHLGSSAKAAVPELLPALENSDSKIRAYAAFSLASIGPSAKCAIPRLASLMWDKDGEVRTAAASAIDLILGMSLVDHLYEVNPNKPNGFWVDDPEGTITIHARDWWLDKGSKMQWPENCLSSEEK